MRILHHVSSGLIVGWLALFGAGIPLAAAQPETGASTAPTPDASDEQTESGSDHAPTPPQGEPIDGDRRRVPDYDGREQPPTSVGDVARWVPRLVFLPVRLTIDGLIRRPIGLLTQKVKPREVSRGIGYVAGVGDTALGIEPIISSGAGTTASFGLSLFTEDLVRDRVDFRIGAAGRVDRNLLLRTQMGYDHPDLPARLEMSIEFERRDDNFFTGLGPHRRRRPDGRFARRQFLGGLRAKVGPLENGLGGRIAGDIQANRINCTPHLSADACGPDKTPGTSDDLYPVRRPGIAPLTTNYTITTVSSQIYWDTRHDERGTGLRLEALGEFGRGIGLDSADLRHLRYGGEIGGFLDVFGRPERTLGLRVRAEAVEPLGDGRAPVPELIALGGLETMRGFRDKEFRGQSTILGTLNYRYPVWTILHGQIFVEAGNVFGAGFSELDPGLFRASAGLGFRSEGVLSSQTSYDVNLAVGSSAFGASPFTVETFRVNIGTNWGF